MTELFLVWLIANTISAVPKAIDTMLKENYKKIATINLNKNIGINIRARTINGCKCRDIFKF